MLMEYLFNPFAKGSSQSSNQHPDNPQGGMIFQFEFYPVNVIPNMKPTMVWSYDKDTMQLFLRQHGFDLNNARVNVVPCIGNINDETMLSIYKFGSRKRDRIYQIATTEEILACVLKRVGFNLSRTLSFGSASLRGDIQIFEHLMKLVTSLNFAYNIDSMAADASDYDTIDREEYINGYPYYESFAINSDDSFVYESLFDETGPTKPYQPVTIESYVSLFTESYIIGSQEEDLRWR